MRARTWGLRPTSSLGCLTYEALTGRTPFAGRQLMQLMYAHVYETPPRASEAVPSLGAAVDDVILTALAKDPAERYPTVRQFADELARALANVGDHSLGRA